MRWFGWLLSAYLPLCATQGATGIKPPGIVDFSHFKRAPHSTFLVAPASFTPAPDVIAPVYAVAAPVLFADLKLVAASRPRIFPLDIEPAALQAAWVVRSAGGNFPDIVEVAALPEGPNRSSLIFYSHSIYGWSGYGVNADRGRIWLKLLDLKVEQ